jgi:predicted phage tail protein
MGSGRMAKGVAQVIGARQKHQGMRGSPTGRKALGILQVVERTQQGEPLWFPQQVAA